MKLNYMSPHEMQVLQPYEIWNSVSFYLSVKGMGPSMNSQAWTSENVCVEYRIQKS